MAGSLSPEDPERLGEFWLAGRLGAGGQGVVYEAYDRQGHRVAVKVLHGDAAADPELKERFGREAAAARRVSSFCTARVIEARLDGPRPYIVSEYVAGPSLRRAVQDGRVFSGDDLHRLATAIATALTAVHEAGVIHRDLKPDNVLLGPDGPRVIDFGIARTLEMSLTSTGLVRGTPTYMAPEVFTGQRAGTAADVFAWGGIVLFAATGADPFKAESLGGVMHRVLSVDPDLSVLPGSLRALAGAALAKEPGERPTARELLMALISGGSAVDTALLLARGSRAAGALHADGHDPALGTLAEEAYGALGVAERDLVPEVFLRLVAIGPDGELTTRKVSEDELPSNAGEVLQTFAYVLSRRDGEVGLARPALLRAWPRLRSWVADERDGLAVHAGIRGQARQWAGHGRRDGDLLQGSRLDSAVGWAATGRRRLTLNALEREFLDASTALTRRRARRRRMLTLALAVLLVLALAGGGLAAYQGNQIAAQRDRAQGREIALLAGTLRTSDPTTAMLLSVAAWRLDGGAEARSGLMSSLYRPETAVFREPATREEPVRALSADGARLLSVSPDEIRLYDVSRQRLIRRVATPEMKGEFLERAALSRSGRFAAVVTAERVRVWALETGRLLGRLNAPGMRMGGDVGFGDDESKLALAEDSNAFVWDYASGTTYGRAGHGEWRGFPQPAVSRTGRLVAVRNDQYDRIDVRRIPGGAPDPRFRKACPRTVRAVAFSPDGKILACAGREIALVSTSTGERLPLLHSDYGKWSWPENGGMSRGTLRFSDDGSLLVGVGDRTIRAWRVSDQLEVFGYKAGGDVSDVGVDPDGRTLRYLLDDSVITVDFRPGVTVTRVPGPITTTGLSPDGRWMSVQGEEGPIRIWDVRRRRFAGSLPGTGDSSVPVVFDRAGRTMITQVDVGSGKYALQAWDVATRTRLWRFRMPGDERVDGAAFSPDGKIFAASFMGVSEATTPSLHLWDARTGRVIRSLSLERRRELYTGSLDFSPDGRTLVASAGLLIDSRSGKQVGSSFSTSSHDASLDVVAVSPVGALLAVGGAAGRIALWQTSARGPALLPPVLRSSAGDISSVAFSPGGDVLATHSGTGTVEFWDVRTRRRLGGAIALYEDTEVLESSMAFAPDGSWLYVADYSGEIFELPIGAERVAAAVCARAGRTLTEQEWARYLPSLPYRNVCTRPSP
ncbi:serine/threonine-protein kinase [Microbispora sp. NPDC046933]|uniref:serine/threonine-protein kinase n=1 Tax=Microbispora sp. NPDC046933 TaxID=3155618 RepID=UPI0033C86416